MTSSDDRSHESIINDALARVLRDRCNLQAVAETLRAGKRPDIVVRLAEGPVVVETEVDSARTVEAVGPMCVDGGAGGRSNGRAWWDGSRGRSAVVDGGATGRSAGAARGSSCGRSPGRG